MSENQTSILERYVQSFVPYVAQRVANILPDELDATAEGIETGIIFHIGNIQSFFAKKKEQRKGFTIAHRGSSNWNTERKVATVWLNPTIGDAETAVRFMLESAVLAVYGEDLSADGRRAAEDSISAVGILKSGKLSAAVLADVQELVKVAGPWPIPPIGKKVRQRSKSGTRQIKLVCPGSVGTPGCETETERNKPQSVGCYVSRSQSTFGWKCPFCGVELVTLKSKKELDEARQSETVTESAEVPE